MRYMNFFSLIMSMILVATMVYCCQYNSSSHIATDGDGDQKDQDSGFLDGHGDDGDFSGEGHGDIVVDDGDADEGDATVDGDSSRGDGDETADGDSFEDGGEASADADMGIPCSEEIEALADEIYATPQECTAIIRINNTLNWILGYQIICGPFYTPTEAEARGATQECSGDVLNPPDPADEYVFYLLIDDYDIFTCGSAVSSRTGLLVFEGWAADLAGEFTYPTSWRPASELGIGCGQSVSVQNVVGYDLLEGKALSDDDVAAALAVALDTAMPSAFAIGGNLRSAVVLYQPTHYDAVIPLPAEWIVLINGGP